MDLSGKVAVVTGGARGIGRAIAEGFAQSGADVVVADIDFREAKKSCTQIQRLGVRTEAIRCDVSQSVDADKLVKTTIKEFGHLDVFVNNAGISGSAKPIIDMPDEEWHQTLEINLSGIFFAPGPLLEQ